MENISCSINGPLAEVTIKRPKALNALNSQTLKELGILFGELSENSELRVVIITGAGDKAFVAGADISEMQEMDPNGGRNFARLAQKVFSLIENMPQVVIAAVNGFALGGGCELAMSCDIRIASTKAKFGQPEVSLGIIPGFAGTQRLPRLVGKGIAKELIFTGEMIDVYEAYRIGLVNKIFEPEVLMERAREMAGVIMSRGPRAVSYAKEAINDGMTMHDEAAYSYEAGFFGLCFATKDRNEGINAFLEKRKANFTGN